MPDVAVPGADRGAPAVGEEVEARGPHLAEPGIVVGERQDIDGERPVVAADDRLRLEDLRPSLRAAVSEASSGGSGAGEVAAYASSAFGPPPDISTLSDPRRSGAAGRSARSTRRAATGSPRPDRRRGSRRPSAGPRASISSSVDGPISRVRVKIGDAGLRRVGLEAGHLEDVGRRRRCRRGSRGRRGGRGPGNAPSSAAAVRSGDRRGRRMRADRRHRDRPGLAQPGPSGFATWTRPTTRGGPGAGR